jgi:hypothetical protein
MAGVRMVRHRSRFPAVRPSPIGRTTSEVFVRSTIDDAAARASRPSKACLVFEACVPFG